MKIFLFFTLLFVLSLNAKDNNQKVIERIVTLEVQMKELNKMIDSRSGLLQEKQGIFLEQEKRFNGLKDKCDDSVGKIDHKIKNLDDQFKNLYSKYNIANIAAGITILGAILAGIFYICRILSKHLNNLEENYKNKINDISEDASRRITAIVNEADIQIRRYQSTVDDSQSEDEDDSNEQNTDNPF